MDSIYSHANWGRSLGGVSFPLLSDFEPKGGLAKSLGLFLDGPGLTDRATVIVDRQGVVQYASSVGPGGRRKIGDLCGECEKIGGDALPAPGTGNLPSGTRLFIKSNCGPSRAAILGLYNLHQEESVTISNVTEDNAALAELEKVGGKNQAPCLLLEGKAVYESADIVTLMMERVAPLPG